MTLIDALTQTPDDKRLFAQEEAILDFTELVCELMEREGVSRSELASRLGKSKGYVSQLLAGEANMTIRTMSDLMHVLGFSLRFSAMNHTPKLRETILLRSAWNEIRQKASAVDSQAEFTISALAG